jgi:hypothetical protein
MSVAFAITVDDSQAITKVQQWEAKVDASTQRANAMVDKVDAHREVSARSVVTMAHSAYSIFSRVLDAAGISLGGFGGIISSVFSVIAAIVAMASAEASTGFGAFQAALTLVLASIALGQAIAAQSEQARAEASLQTTKETVRFSRSSTMI